MEKIKNIIFSGKNLKREIFAFSLFFFLIIPIANAGNLDSPGSPGATGYTLSDIYTRLTTNATAVENTHPFSPSADPASSFRTLKEIYDAIPTINPALVKFGQSYLGIPGTLLPNGGTADLGEVLDGETFFGNNQADWTLQTGTMPNIGQQNITPGTLAQTISEGYHDGTGAVSGDPDLVAGKIKSGENIFGVAGQYPSASYYLPGDTGATDATATEICNTNEAWTKEGTKMAGTLNPTAASIGTGNTYCGTAGTLLKNEYNGSAGNTTPDFALYTQALGGIEDYNRGKTSGGLGVMPDGAYSSTWTDCSVGDNCGLTGADIALADKKDDSTKLIWSKWLNAGATYTWFQANNCYPPGTAVKNPAACAADSDDGCGCVKIIAPDVLTGCASIGDGNWRTPYQKELMQAYIDGSWGNLTNAGHFFWSATTTSNATQTGWYVGLLYGSTYTATKVTPTRVRCVR